MIVDSPGIGETTEMKELVLDYILKACTFIYVINSTCAGGVQDRVGDSRSFDLSTATLILSVWTDRSGQTE